MLHYTDKGFSWPSAEHTNTNDVELKASLQQLLFDLRRDAVETDMVLGEDRLRLLCLSSGCHCG